MNKREQKRALREAQRVVEALQTIDEFCKHNYMSFRFIEQNHDYNSREVNLRTLSYVMDELKREILFNLYRRQQLSDEAIEKARSWHYGMFAGVTMEREEIATEGRDKLLRSMAIQGMMWDEITKTWYGPEQRAQIEYMKKRHGSRWAAVYYDGAQDYDY